MVAFKYGEWDYICRVSPQPICNLFFRQLLVHPDHGVEAAPDPYLGLPSDDPSARQSLVRELGLGIRSSCSIPRMETAGGQLNSLGNVADIVLCCFSIFVVIGLILKAFRRKAAVARVELIILLGLYGLMKFFEIFDTGSFLEQGSQSIVWLTSIHLALTVLFYFSLVWLGFLGLQLVEDGSKISLLPLLSCLAFLFFGSIYIFLDTGFGVTHYFSSQPASHLYSPWTFTMVILWPFIALTIYAGLTILVSVRILGELKPVVVLLCSMMTIAMGTIFRWILTQPICHSSSGTVDGSFMGSLLELVSVGLLVYIWVCLTEAEWDEYSDMAGLGYPGGPAFDNQFINGSLISRHPPPPAISPHDDQLVIVDRISSLDGRPDHLPLDAQHPFKPPQAANIQHQPLPDDPYGPLVKHNYDGLEPPLDASHFNK